MSELAERVRSRLAGDAAGSAAGDLTGRTRRSAAVTPSVLDTALRREAAGVVGVVDDAVFAGLRREVCDELTGAGPLEPLLALPGVTDVLVNGPDQVWIDRGAGLERSDVAFPDDAAVRRLAQRLATAAGRRLDDAAPWVDAALPDGTRLHAVLPPLAACTLVSLRVLARRRLDLPALVDAGSLPAAVADVLTAVMSARLAFLVTGGTGSGKTTLLGALLGLVPPHERVLLIEDAAELVVAHPHVVRLTTRPANIEGAGAVGVRELVRQALRMRPDRLVVGEFRGPEMVDLVVALNTGHEGGAATLHANSAADVPARVAALGALAGLTDTATCALVGAAIELVVHLVRDRRGTRRLDELAVLHRDGDRLRTLTVWRHDSGVGPAAAQVAAALHARGVAVPGLLQGAPPTHGCAP